MTVTLTTSPADALARLACRVTATASAGNFVRLWCTDAPTGSIYKTQLVDSGASRVVFQAGIDAGKHFDWTPDMGGVYRIQAEEIQLGAAAYGGGYKGDPNAAQSETVIGTDALSLSVATALTSRMGAGQDTAELLTYVKGANIIATRQDVHGVASPVIRVASSSKAQVAVDATTVRAALALLANTSAATLLGSLTAVFNDLRAQFEAHRASGSIHYTADTMNEIDAALVGPATESALIAAFGTLRSALDFHFRNDDKTAVPPGTGTGPFHAAADGSVALLAPPPSDIAGCALAAADCHRAYEQHRVRTIHETTDPTNVAAALPALLALHSAFFAVLASLSPATPDNEHAGVTTLVSGAGFQRA